MNAPDVSVSSYAGPADPECYFCASKVGHTDHEHNFLRLHAAKPIKAKLATEEESVAHKVNEMDTVSVILWLEGGDLLDRIRTRDDAKAVLAKIEPLRNSTGTYQRLCYQLDSMVD